MATAAMLLSNPFRPDPRVLKEASSLAAAGFKITVICWDRNTEYPPQERLASGLEIRRVQSVPSTYGIGSRQIGPLYHFWRAAEHILAELKPDLIHCHDFDTLPAGLAWGRKLRVPVIYDAHEYYADLVRPRLKGIAGQILYRMIRFAEKSAARRAQAIITVDKPLADRYRSLNRRVLVIGHYPPRQMAAHPAAVFTHPELNLLYLGRLSRDRGLPAYLEILRLLRNAGIPARLILAGVFTPSGEADWFEQESKPLSNWIKVTGWIPYEHVSALLAQADVGLCLLQSETRYVAALPVKLFEYMAAGLPVLASDFPAVRQVVEQSDCGALLDPLDAQAAAAALARWQSNAEIPARLGENGRRAVLDRYNWETLAETLADLYRSLCS
jgi:glycosyltransferase involved in cell wall biosynthesis